MNKPDFIIDMNNHIESLPQEDAAVVCESLVELYQVNVDYINNLTLVFLDKGYEESKIGSIVVIIMYNLHINLLTGLTQREFTPNELTYIIAKAQATMVEALNSVMTNKASEN